MINTKALLEPMGSWAWWRSWIQLFVGCAIMGSGFVFFINPYNFVPGGFYRSAFLSKRKVLSYQNTSIIWICLKFASIPEILRALRSGKKTGIPQKTCGITIRNVDLKVKNTNRIESAGNLAQNQNRGDTGTTDPPQQF